MLGRNPELCNGFLELMLYHAIELFGAWDSREDIELNLDKILEHKVGFWNIKFEQGVKKCYISTVSYQVRRNMLVLDMSLNFDLEEILSCYEYLKIYFMCANGFQNFYLLQ